VRRLPSLTGEQLVTILRHVGFEIIRVRGSHCRLSHPDGRKTTVPIHPGETIGRGLLAKIMRDSGLSPEDLH